MKLLIDTNLLLRLSEQGLPQQKLARRAIWTLKKRGDQLIIVPQVLYEYWVVSTRPLAQNGLGLSVSQADQGILKCLRVFTYLPDQADIFDRWRQLVNQHQVLGKTAHDARLVAALLFHGCDGIVTFNASDFQRYPQLTVLTPEQVLAA